MRSACNNSSIAEISLASNRPNRLVCLFNQFGHGLNTLLLSENQITRRDAKIGLFNDKKIVHIEKIRCAQLKTCFVASMNKICFQNYPLIDFQLQDTRLSKQDKNTGIFES